MKYCSSCGRLYEAQEEQCPRCRRPLAAEAKQEDSVYLVTAGGFELDRICAALEDAGIPYEQKAAKKMAAAPVVSGVAGATDVLVAYMDYAKAQDVLIGVGALSVPAQEDADPQQEDGQIEDGEAAQMSRGNLLFCRILSVVLLILLVWAVVAGTDTVISWVKQWFSF